MTHVVSTPSPPFPIAGGRIEVHQIPVWQDNLVWLLVDRTTREAAAVDGPDAGLVLEYCADRDFRLTTILNTHTHMDHVGINHDLAGRGLLAGLQVFGPGKKAREVPGLTHEVDEGSEVSFGQTQARVMLTEGHIDGHVSYVFQGAVFCGDTMFAAGCGYLFDGPPQKMHDSLSRLAQLDEDTRVCCAHEYTQDNLRFAWSVEPDNDALAERIRKVWVERNRGRSVVPSTIGEERATNPFLRTHSPTIVAAVQNAFPDRPLGTPVEIFAATRALKDRKDYRKADDSILPL